MTLLQREGAALRIVTCGQGRPLVFQHGLGGDAAQVAENVPARPGWQTVTLECRAQGESEAGDRRPFAIAMFADDVLAACETLGFDRFVLGGISMGAAVALRIAATQPARVVALILARPAWRRDLAPANMRPFAEVAAALRAGVSREDFAATATARMLAEQAPDNLASLLRFFDRSDPDVTADLLADIAADGPGVASAQVAAIAVPTLVIGHDIDHVHPLATARALAADIAGARFVQVAPKATDKPRHVAEFRAAINNFLNSLEPAP